MKPSRMIEGLIVDNFAGGGGASTGIEEAFRRPVDIAINHDPEAIAMHEANHPDTVHICQSVWKADPVEVTGGRPVALGWFSPDCKHFSKAKGGKPVEKNIRDLAWVVVHWARRVKPRIIMLENVEEFRTWCPVDPVTGFPMKQRRIDGQLTMLPDPNGVVLERKGKRRRIKPEGETFQLWVAALRKAGYGRIEWRELRGCDYGEPTIRKRLFVIARSDGMPIVWPEPTHGPGRQPYRTAAECIDWSIPCPSIFGRKKPLAENTLRRIAHGVMKFVVNAAEPFIVPVTNSTWAPNRADSLDKPLWTITTAKGGEMAIVTPFIARTAHGEVDRNGKRRGKGAHPTDQPLPTATASPDFAVIAPTLIQTGYGERPGQAPRVPGLHKPHGTVVDGCKSGLVAAFLAKHTTGGIGRSLEEPASTVTANGFEKRAGGATPLGIVCAHLEQANGGPNNDNLAGRPVGKPMSTATASGSQQRVIASHLVKLRGTSAHGQPADDALHTVSAQGMHFGQVCAFLAKYFGSAEHGQAAGDPLHTVTALPRFGLVTVTIAGEEYVIVDIGMRMLTPRELARAQGFPDSYVLDPICDRILPSGKRKRGRLPISSQIRMIGNSVNRRVARALVAANCNEPAEMDEAVAA
jgi:DNA (cytosine-5)-methyltransferase 1